MSYLYDMRSGILIKSRVYTNKLDLYDIITKDTSVVYLSFPLTRAILNRYSSELPLSMDRINPNYIID